MKITIAPADIRKVQEALSRVAAAQQWADIAAASGRNIQPIMDRIAAARQVAEGMLTLIRQYEGAIV